MAARTVGLLLCAALAAAEKQSVTPSDIIYGTGSLILDLHSTAYGHVEDLVKKQGIHTKVQEHVSKHLGDDLIGSACAKVGCNKKDITDKLAQAQAAVQQGKAQAYEHGAKVTDLLNGFAGTAVAKFETILPKYKGSLPKNFLDLALTGLYLALVAYYVFRVGWYCFRTSLSIFCCVCCCGCFRGGKSADASKKGKKGGADAKATPKQAAAKQAGKKK
jgi:hypothetical protein